MNNSFDIKRFGKMLRHDVRRCSPAYGTVWAMMISLLFFTPLMTFIHNATDVFEGGADASYRLAMMSFVTIIFATSLPIQLYANLDKKKRNSGIYFAMLPASKLEKYLSIAILSLVVVPVALMTVNVGIDTLLVAVHAPYYSQYLWQSALVGRLTLPVMGNGLLVFVGATLGFIFANGIKSKGWRNMTSFVLILWLMAGTTLSVFIDSMANAMWVVVGINALLTVFTAILSWNKMNKMAY